MNGKSIEDNVLSTFSEIAGSIGYSPLHGKIIGILLIEGVPVSLQYLAKKTGYSVPMVSLSLDLLEVLGTIKKIKKTGDRKLYVQLQGDLLEALKRAVISKVEKGIKSSLSEFEENKKRIEDLPLKNRENAKKTIDVLEKEIRRLDTYMKLLSKIRLP